MYSYLDRSSMLSFPYLEEIIMEAIIENIAENAGRAHSLLEAIEAGSCSGEIELDDINVMSQYAMAYIDNMFKSLDKLSF